MATFADALGVRKDFFDDKIDKHVTNLVALRYPPLGAASATDQPREATAMGATGCGEEEACVLRVKPHTDPTDITILAFEEGPNGLQVLPDGCADWVDVPHVPGSLLVNLGDVLRFWTNDVWRSTRHRVVTRRGVIGDGGDRLSLVFFHMPNYDAVIDCEDLGAAVVGPDRPRRFPAFKSGERSHFAQLVRNEKGLPDRQTLKEDNARGE